MSINEQQKMQRLQAEGFIDIRVCPLPPSEDTPEHTHDVHTVHIVLDGELMITDENGTSTYRPGDRVEFPAGTTHKAKSINGGSMIIGVKNV